MTLSIQQIAKRLSTRSRRALIAMFLTGSLISSIAFAENDYLPIPGEDAALAAQVESDASDNALDYWIFSDDYCGWASAETFSNPLSVDPFATEPARKRPQLFASTPVSTVENVVDQALAASQRQKEMANDLDELAKGEPLDVATNDSVGVTSQHAAQLRGSSPVIVTIAEGYLPYDLDRNDLVSLRTYPITIPQFDYVGADRMSLNGLAGRGPLDCLGHGVVWTETVMPSVSVETKPAPDYLSAIVEVWQDVHRFVTGAIQVATTQAHTNQAAIVSSIVEELQPDGRLQQSLSPIQIGQQLGAAAQTAAAVVEGPIRAASQGIATWNFETAEPLTADPERTAGENLLVRAGIEADALDCATAGVADVAKPMGCLAERSELAAQPPATYQIAAVGLAAATLSLPQVPQEHRDDISRAEAIATACKSTAATLERLAMALRKAGDSVVRVARATAEDNTDLR